MRSIYPSCLVRKIRVGVIHPFFVDTAIVPIPVKIFMAGIPLTPVERVAGAIFYAATDPDMETSGCPWLLLDDGYVVRLEKEELKEGVYKMLNDRIKIVFATVRGVRHTLVSARLLWRLLGKHIVLIGILAGGASYLYRCEGARDIVQQHALEYLHWLGTASRNLLKCN